MLLPYSARDSVLLLARPSTGRGKVKVAQGQKVAGAIGAEQLLVLDVFGGVSVKVDVSQGVIIVYVSQCVIVVGVSQGVVIVHVSLCVIIVGVSQVVVIVDVSQGVVIDDVSQGVVIDDVSQGVIIVDVSGCMVVGRDNGEKEESRSIGDCVIALDVNTIAFSEVIIH